MTRLTVGYRFNASHKMWSAELSEEENRRTFGKCANPAGHGHSYRLEITFERPVSRREPFVLTPMERERLITGLLEPRLAYADLNRVFGEGFIASGERIAQAVRAMIEREFTCGARLMAVRVIETSKNSFVCYGHNPEGEPA